MHKKWNKILIINNKKFEMYKKYNKIYIFKDKKNGEKVTLIEEGDNPCCRWYRFESIIFVGELRLPGPTTTLVMVISGYCPRPRLRSSALLSNCGHAASHPRRNVWKESKRIQLRIASPSK